MFNYTPGKNTQYVLGSVAIIVLIGLIGWYIVEDLKTDSPKPSEEQMNQEQQEEVVIQEESSGTIQTPVADIPHPLLNREVMIPENFPEEAAVAVRENIETLTAQITENPNLFQSWMNLAAQYKIINDFEGAAEVWEYLNKVAPQNTLARVNLGNLYHYDLKEYAKSESAFKAALAVEEDTPQAYLGLHELYRYSYKTDTANAKDILNEAMEALPENVDVVMALASYYKDLGRTSEAVGAYQEARTRAEKLGNTALVTTIDAEIAKLTQ